MIYVPYATSPRGACHLKGDYYNVELMAGAIPELEILPGDRMTSEGKGKPAAVFRRRVQQLLKTNRRFPNTPGRVRGGRRV